jgi:hypothetical protein
MYGAFITTHITTQICQAASLCPQGQRSFRLSTTGSRPQCPGRGRLTAVPLWGEASDRIVLPVAFAKGDGDLEESRRVAGNDVLDFIEMRRGPMLHGEREVIAIAAQIEVGVVPGVELG